MNRATPLSTLLKTFAGPLVWFMHLSLLYGGATIACRSGEIQTGFPIFALTVTAAAVAILLGHCFRQARLVAAGKAGRDADSFLVGLLLVLSALSILAMIWTAWAALTLGCGD